MSWPEDEKSRLEDRLQQPLTATRLMVEGALHGVVETSPEMLGKILFCLAEMQDILDDVEQTPAYLSQAYHVT